MAAPEHIVYAADGRLDTDVYCVGCGYNLRGQLPTGVCGECAARVEWSLRGSALYFADPNWVARLRSGVAWLTLVLPWLWVPLSWPVFLIAFWRVTARAPDQRGDVNRLVPLGLRTLMLALLPIAIIGIGVAASSATAVANATARFGLLFVGALAALVMTYAVYRLARRGAATWFRIACRAVMSVYASAAALLAGGFVNTVGGIGLFVLDVGAFLGLVAAVLGLPVLLVVLAATWRMLAAAEHQSRAIRLERRAWRTREPGLAFLSRKMSPGAAHP